MEISNKYIYSKEKHTETMIEDNMYNLRVLVLKDLTLTEFDLNNQFKECEKKDFFEVVKSVSVFKSKNDYQIVIPSKYELNGMFIYEDHSVDEEYELFKREFDKAFGIEVLNLFDEFDETHFLSICLDKQVILPFLPHLNRLVLLNKRDSDKITFSYSEPIMKFPFYKIEELIKMILITFHNQFQDSKIFMSSQNRGCKKKLIERDFFNCIQNLNFQYQKFELKCSSELLNKKTDKFFFYCYLIEQLLCEKKMIINILCDKYQDEVVENNINLDFWRDTFEESKNICWKNFHKQYCLMKKITSNESKSINPNSLDWIKFQLR